ncbi:MAG: hypothetical protein WBA89_05585 [Microcoleus sp.]
MVRLKPPGPAARFLITPQQSGDVSFVYSGAIVISSKDAIATSAFSK